MILLPGLLGPQSGLLTGETDGRGVGEAPRDAASCTHTHTAQLFTVTVRHRPQSPHTAVHTHRSTGTETPPLYTDRFTKYIHVHTLNTARHSRHESTGRWPYKHTDRQTDVYTIYTCMTYSHTQRDAYHTHIHTDGYTRSEYTGR